MIKDFLKKNKSRIFHECGVWVTLALSMFLTEGAELLKQLYIGEYNKALFMSIGMLLINSLVRSAMIKLVPSLFPLYRKDEGILPHKKE